MPDIFDLLARWWKRILAVMVLSLLVVGVITFLKPRKYLSIATAIPANSFASDKARVFSENIEALYSTFGTPDDLDLIVGTADLDTIYWAVAVAQYDYDEQWVKQIQKMASTLKKNTKVMKSPHGELKVKVWYTQKELAAELANAIVEKLNAVHQKLQNESNKAVLNNLKASREKLIYEADGITAAILNDSLDNSLERSQVISVEQNRARIIRRNAIWEQLVKYEKLINEYQMMVDSRNPVLLVAEQAHVSDKPDKPKTMQIMIATAVLSFLFALLAALVLERRKNVVR